MEDKIKSLLDLLYGCNACGVLDCECNDSYEGDCGISLPTSTPSSPPATPTTGPTVEHLLPPSSGSAPWTPPLTPPCPSCGGINFGPCPNNVCFACVPPLQPKPITTSSPSRTPPGTPPPLQRLEQSAARTRLGET